MLFLPAILPFVHADDNCTNCGTQLTNFLFDDSSPYYEYNDMMFCIDAKGANPCFHKWEQKQKQEQYKVHSSLPWQGKSYTHRCTYCSKSVNSKGWPNGWRKCNEPEKWFCSTSHLDLNKKLFPDA